MTNNYEPRTNSSKEAFHKVLQTVTNSHPTVWMIIGCLWREQALASKPLVDLLIGGDDRKYNYRHINNKLEIIVKQYGSNKRGVFVENVSA